MKKNPVELLSIVNPGDEKINLSRRDYQLLGLGAVAGAGIIWLLNKLRASYQPAVGVAQSPLPGGSGLLILGVLGVAGWYVWSQYRASAGESAPVLSNPKKKSAHKKYHRSEKQHSSGTRYFVRVSGTDEIYPKPGSKDYPGGYSLRSAQDFARIGSQTGGARKVLRGSAHGPVVRKYEDGKRVWPKTVAQAKSLRPAERPSKLRESA